MRKLKYAQGDLASNVKSLKEELGIVQSDMVKDPSNAVFRQKEADVLMKLKDAIRDEELFLKQRYKVNWLNKGDHNTKFFHRAMKEKMNSNRMECVEDLEVDAEYMIKHVSCEEVKTALFSMDDDKAPGPDRFSSKNFKASWSVVGPEFTKAIQDFFLNGKLLKEINATIIALVKPTHLIFADDLMLFSNGDNVSVSILKKALEEFSKVSGLVLNLEKSVVFFGKVPSHIKRSILKVMPFFEGSLPIRYLGVPLISSRLYKNFCDPLIDKVKQRLYNWKNKVLSFAGRQKLIQSIMCSIQVFWSSVFIFPVSVSHEIERMMRGFLWSQGDLQRGKAKEKWDDVYGLKIQGGLGIKSLHTWNVALILVDRRSCERNFWDVHVLNDTCWGWRKLLQYKDVLRNHIVSRIGNGCDISMWFNNWCFLGPLCQFISKRDIFEAGLSLNCKVAYLVHNGEWV
ncbi:RNA-directed DNA polymerase, eukaryota, reverse transcriptase zinc-binding domain protein [Tanacetum coccineum]